ncbi:MAG: metallophosphoesterase family protein [candidate division KSB1 bacterium]
MNLGATNYRRIIVFGGVYNNYLSLASLLREAQSISHDAIFCLGDLGAFGPHPNRVYPLLVEGKVQVVQGNYDNSIGNDLKDCQCGYTDPRDNYFAQISYDYTQLHTSNEFKAYQKALPPFIRFEAFGKKVLLCHGSPRQTNEFLWESTTPTHFLQKLFVDYEADVILTTHTGVKWQRRLPDGKFFANVGVIGRPENDGRTNVWYSIVHFTPELQIEYRALEYDHQRLAREMKEEKLPQEFIDTVRAGWWTTCLEILPGKERARGKF